MSSITWTDTNWVQYHRFLLNSRQNRIAEAVDCLARKALLPFLNRENCVTTGSDNVNVKAGHSLVQAQCLTRVCPLACAPVSLARDGAFRRASLYSVATKVLLELKFR